MGMWDSVRRVLGMSTPLVVRDVDAPLRLTDRALARFSALGPGQGIHVACAEVGDGWVVEVTEGPAQGPPPPGFEVALTASDIDLRRLTGMKLDHVDDAWRVSTELELRARETPNPDGRLYLADRPLAFGRPRQWEPGVGLPPLASRLVGVAGVRSVLLRDNTATVVRDPAVPWASIDHAVDATLREYFVFLGRPVSAEEAAAADPFVQELQQALEHRVMEGVRRDGGDIVVVGHEDGVVRVAMQGACSTCPSSQATLRSGVERTLREAFPGRVDAGGGSVIVWLWLGCDLGPSWKQVQATDTVEAYEAFLARDPGTIHAYEIERRLEELYWDDATASYDRAKWERFVARFPNSKRNKEAQREVQLIAFSAARTAGTAEALRALASEFPKLDPWIAARAEGLAAVMTYGGIVIGAPTVTRTNLGEVKGAEPDGWAVTATVTNTGPETLSYVRITLEWLDGAGVVIGTQDYPLVSPTWNLPAAEDQIRPMKPRDARTWQWTEADATVSAHWKGDVRLSATDVRVLKPK